MSLIATTPPEWQPDSSTKSCTLCSRKFTLWFRRHHCRKCGKVVCHLCSSARRTYEITTPIVESPNQIFYETIDMPHRTCDVCVEEIIASAIIRETSPEIGAEGGEPQNPVQIPSIVAKRRSRYIKDQTTQQTLDMGTHAHSEPEEEDENDRCPICFTMIKNLDDRAKEEHINSCLVNLEFKGSPETHHRVANRMLVYDIPDNYLQQRLQTLDEVMSSTEQEPASSSSHLDLSNQASSSSQLHSQLQPSEKPHLETTAPEECVICLEEFEPGDKVGRLECLCVFHYNCIKGWFKKKGPGDCPIHAVHL